MLASQLENADDKHPSEKVAKEDISIEQGIECPRCHDVMTLHSEFDRLGYVCEECSFSLYLSH
jgi:DNA-directed RNA polymerase subunit RPC12/RpoP